METSKSTRDHKPHFPLTTSLAGSAVTVVLVLSKANNPRPEDRKIPSYLMVVTI